MTEQKDKDQSRSGQPQPAVEPLTHAPKCGAVSGLHVCDREPGHAGSHRAYLEQHDEVVFWEEL